MRTVKEDCLDAKVSDILTRVDVQMAERSARPCQFLEYSVRDDIVADIDRGQTWVAPEEGHKPFSSDHQGVAERDLRKMGADVLEAGKGKVGQLTTPVQGQLVELGSVGQHRHDHRLGNFATV